MSLLTTLTTFTLGSAIAIAICFLIAAVIFRWRMKRIKKNIPLENLKEVKSGVQKEIGSSALAFTTPAAFNSSRNTTFSTNAFREASTGEAAVKGTAYDKRTDGQSDSVQLSDDNRITGNKKRIKLS